MSRMPPVDPQRGGVSHAQEVKGNVDVPVGCLRLCLLEELLLLLLHLLLESRLSRRLPHEHLGGRKEGNLRPKRCGLPIELSAPRVI